jgi:hypothetical protein
MDIEVSTVPVTSMGLTDEELLIFLCAHKHTNDSDSE